MQPEETTQLREKLAFWTLQLREERSRRRRALGEAPHRLPYHRQREQVMQETINALRDNLNRTQTAD